VRKVIRGRLVRVGKGVEEDVWFEALLLLYDCGRTHVEGGRGLLGASFGSWGWFWQWAVKKSRPQSEQYTHTPEGADERSNLVERSMTLMFGASMADWGNKRRNSPELQAVFYLHHLSSESAQK